MCCAVEKGKEVFFFLQEAAIQLLERVDDMLFEVLNEIKF